MYIELLSFLARAGGGGSSGGGGAAGIIVLPIILVAAILTWRKRQKYIKAAKQAQAQAILSDHTWRSEVIEKRVSEVFYAFQKDWSNFNYKNMASYLTPRYLKHMQLVLMALKQMGRRNSVKNVNLRQQHLFGVQDHADDELDRFNVNIHAFVTDKLVDENNQKVLKTSSDSFEEMWHFEREQGHWMLDSITQVNKDKLVAKFHPQIDQKYLDFAQQNNFFYNADFGWLLLPFDGRLFSQSDYGRSDINHHILGLYKNVLVQFFEYKPYANNNDAKLRDNLRHFYKRSENPFATYTIAQATLPKNYENIIVEKKQPLNFFDYTPAGMHKVELEWPEFNKAFKVYASDKDKVNSLELLHPAFMVKLKELKFRVSIEIVGHNLYLWTTDKDADYPMMLAVLHEAFDEMKM